MSDIIEDCLIIIFNHFDYRNLLQLEQVCKRWQCVIRTNPQLFWYKTPQAIIRSFISNSKFANQYDDYMGEEIMDLLISKASFTIGSCNGRFMCYM